MQRIVSVLTVLLGLNALSHAIDLLIVLHVPGVVSYLTRLLIIAVIGICGGFLAWRGERIGYMGATLVWAAALVMFISGNPTIRVSVGEHTQALIPLSAIISIPMLFVLYFLVRARTHNNTLERTGDR